MASPQKENGYTPIANEILEKIAIQPLNGTQFRILLVVWRYTYGYSRKEHELSETFISRATSIHKKQIQRELMELINFRIITVEKQPTFNSSRIISFNKDYDSWEVTKKLPANKKDTQTGNELAPSTGSELAPQENNNKTNIKQMAMYEFFEECWNRYPKKEGKNKVKPSRKKELYKLGDELIRTIDRYRNIVKDLDWQYIQQGGTFFNGGYLDYLDENYQKSEENKNERTRGWSY